MQSYSNRAYMHGYYSIFAYMHNFASIDVGVFFLLKCVKLTIFWYFAVTDAIALMQCECKLFKRILNYSWY